MLKRAVIHRMVIHLAGDCADFHPVGVRVAEAPTGYQPLWTHQVTRMRCGSKKLWLNKFALLIRRTSDPCTPF